MEEESMTQCSVIEPIFPDIPEYSWQQEQEKKQPVKRQPSWIVNYDSDSSHDSDSTPEPHSCPHFSPTKNDRYCVGCEELRAERDSLAFRCATIEAQVAELLNHLKHIDCTGDLTLWQKVNKHYY